MTAGSRSDIISTISRKVFYPLWDVWDGSRKLKTLRVLESTQWQPLKGPKQLQWKNVQEIIRYSYEHCSYYRASFDKVGIRPDDIRSANDMSCVPVLSKDRIRENTDKLISDEFPKKTLILAKTGGSTGKSLHVYFDKACQEARNAAALRSMIWAGWNLGERVAAVWGNPPIHDTLKKRVRNALLDRMIYLDTMNLNEKSIANFLRMCQKLKPSLVYGHSRSLYILAQFCLVNRKLRFRPKGIISTSMMLLPHERSTISEAFNCSVTDRYGCEEVGLIACECEKHEGMHLNSDHLYVEFVKGDGALAEPGDEAEIVVTDLINRGMPLIRYRIEDRGIPTFKMCSCGRALPLMEKVTGRTADYLVKKDGSLVAGVSLIERTLTKVNGICQMQILQDDVDHIILRIVRDREYGEQSEKELTNEFRAVFGNSVNISISYMRNLPQTQSGKYRFAESRVKATVLGAV